MVKIQKYFQKKPFLKKKKKKRFRRIRRRKSSRLKSNLDAETKKTEKNPLKLKMSLKIPENGQDVDPGMNFPFFEHLENELDFQDLNFSNIPDVCINDISDENNKIV